VPGPRAVRVSASRGAPSGRKATFAAGLLFLSRDHAFMVTPLMTRARTRRSPLVRFVSPAAFTGRAVLVRGCQPLDHPVSAFGHDRPLHPQCRKPVRALALAVFLSAVAPELPIPIRTIGTSSASPRGSFVHGFFDYVLCVRRNRPAAGHFRGLAELPLKNLGRRSATFMGFDSGSALRSFTPSGGCEASFEVTRPRAVEPRAARDYCDVRHRCRGPVAAIRTADGLGPGIAPASGV
jgi:hypothetical protein